MKDLASINKYISDIDLLLVKYNNALKSDNCVNPIRQEDIAITNNIAQFIATHDYSTKKNDKNSRLAATHGANAAYRQSKQSTMMYNLTVSSLVNIICGLLILSYFIAKELKISSINIGKGIGVAKLASAINDNTSKNKPNQVDKPKQLDKPKQVDKPKQLDKPKQVDKPKLPNIIKKPAK